jgi:two-component system phosphate regulon sensor histidine kinase PhoR
LTRRITRPISRLTRLAGRYTEGSLGEYAHLGPYREIAQLGETLGNMSGEIQARIGELTGERNRLDLILQSMAEGVVALDARGRILFANPAAAILLRIGGSDFTGQALGELVRQPDIRALVDGILLGRRRQSLETLVASSGRNLRIHGLPCDAVEPGSPSAILVVQDVTENLRYDQLRREFVANVSHELKSPLTSIRSLTETLLSGAREEPETALRFLRLIEEDTIRLTRLIDDLLSLSLIESGAVPLVVTEVDLRALAASVLEELSPAAEARRLTIELDLPDPCPATADPDRVRQILVNFLDNAIKYNRPGGSIRVSAAREGSWVRFSIADTGLGIEEHHLARIFERFYRVDPARSRELGGTGLGLSIVKHIVEAHGGQVQVTSRPGEGSVFSFTLPISG